MVGLSRYREFFPSVSVRKVGSALEALGYVDNFPKTVIPKLTCLNQGLTQGAPSSPVLSNIVLNDLDIELAKFADAKGFVYTCYADDIVVSGSTGSPEEASHEIQHMVRSDGWTIAEQKTSIDRLPRRLKVHGLLVHGDRIRLTKGYRNRLRAYRHLHDNGRIRDGDIARIRGHIEFARSVEQFNQPTSDQTEPY